MPYCAKCGADLKEDDKFCSACGTPVATPVAEPERRVEREEKKPMSTLTIVLIVLVVVVVVVAVGVMALFWALGGIWPGPWSGGRVVGSGNLVSGEMVFSDFTAVDVERSFEVVITQSSSYSVIITADERIFDDVQVSKTGETLKIGLKQGIYESLTLRAEVTMPDLYELRLSSGSHGTVEGFSLDRFVLGLSGGSHVKAEGAAKDLSISASSGSHLDLSNFPVHDADVNLSGGSHATINLDGRLDADLSGGSHLFYIGEPNLGEIETSSGSIVSKKYNS